MPALRSLLARVNRLEQAREPVVSPVQRAYGSSEAFAAAAQAEMDAGSLDPRDGPYVIAAVRRWHNERPWDGWR